MSDVWSAANGWAGVTLTKRNGIFTETIAQNGANIPCAVPGTNTPNEFDLFIAPNGLTTTAYPNGVNASVYSNTNQFPRLGQLSSFLVTGAYSLNLIQTAGGSPCQTANHAYSIYGITLANTVASPHQFLWYAVIISLACAPGTSNGPGSDWYWCQLGLTNPTPSWYWTGVVNPGSTDVNFGVNDVMPSFGLTTIEDYNLHGLSFDFLTRLTNLIQNNQYGMDKDLSHWQVTVVDFGQEIWGNTFMQSTWEGFVPTWTVKN